MDGRDLKMQFIEDIARSNSMVVASDGLLSADLSLRGIRAAADAIDACLKQLPNTGIGRDARPAKKLSADNENALREATDISNEAEDLYKSGNYAAAEPLLRRALAITEKVLESHHPDIATRLNNLAKMFEAKYDYIASLNRSFAVPWPSMRNLWDLTIPTPPRDWQQSGGYS